MSSLNEELTKKTQKYLAKLEKQEGRLRDKLANIDPETSRLFKDSKEKYTQFSAKLKDKNKQLSKITGGFYNANLYTLCTTFSFLNQFKDISGNASKPLQDIQVLKDQFQHSEKIKQYIANQKRQMKELLSKYAKVPKALQKQYEKYSKTAFYFSAQLKEYREILQNPSKIEKRTLTLLKSLKPFQKFMKENSELASLFGMPENNSGTAALTGLQTRTAVQTQIRRQISIGGSLAEAQVQQNLSMAHAELNRLKDKINKYGGSEEDIDMPDFSVNTQKTKKFFQRLELGNDVQFSKSNRFVPNSADLAFSVAYKAGTNKLIGFGSSLNMGIGDIRHIKFSGQGVTLRSFLEVKVKGSFYASGGFEKTYNSQFRNIDELKNYSSWTTAGLVGISKRYQISKKVKGEMKLLYNLLAYRTVPFVNPIAFRLGYIWK